MGLDVKLTVCDRKRISTLDLMTTLDHHLMKSPDLHKKKPLVHKKRGAIAAYKPLSNHNALTASPRTAVLLMTAIAPAEEDVKERSTVLSS